MAGCSSELLPAGFTGLPQWELASVGGRGGEGSICEPLVQFLSSVARIGSPGTLCLRKDLQQKQLTGLPKVPVTELVRVEKHVTVFKQ